MDIKVEYEPDIGPTELVFETVDLPTPSRNISMWSNNETKQLIDFYKSYINEVGPFKRFNRKKNMWNEISLQIATKNPKQCEERFKTLLKRKKKDVEKVYISEAQRKIFVLEAKDGNKNEFQIIRKHKVDSESGDCPAPFKRVQVWSNSETKLLMELYKRLIWEVGPHKKFIHKKDMWAAISTNFQNKDPKQCEQRYNTVLKRKKKPFTKVHCISKARRKTIDIKAKSVETTSKINGAHALNNNETKIDIVHIGTDPQEKQTASAQNSMITTERPEVLTISETLLQIASKKEEGKERRHRERMEAMHKMQNILQQILNNKLNNTNV